MRRWRCNVGGRGFIRRGEGEGEGEQWQAQIRGMWGGGTRRRRGGGGGIVGENKLGMLAMEEPLISSWPQQGLPRSLAIRPVARTAPQPLSYLPGTAQLNPG